MRKVIVSLTSYPKRIHTVYKVVESIMRQTWLPDKIVLYLSSSEFKDFKGFPDLTGYEKYGFEIHWYEENLKSHKKWYYAFQEYSDDIVITVDDDIVYSSTAIENLMKYHKRYPDAVIARRGHLIMSDMNGGIAPYHKWYQECDVYIGEPRMDIMPTGNGGVLYPPHIYGEELYCKNVFMDICQFADDIWLKMMGVFNNVPVVLAQENWDDFIMDEWQEDGLYNTYNDNGGNDKQLKDLLKLYPYDKSGKTPLLECVWKDGKTYEAERGRMESQKMEKILDNLKRKLQAYEEVLVYGAGEFGKKILTLLKQDTLHTMIKAFVVNDVTSNPNTIDGIGVKDYRDYIDKTEKIIIALYSNDVENTVVQQLVNEGIDRSRFIFLNKYEKKALMRMEEKFSSSGTYWENRYVMGGNSGAGSYNRLADFKAKVLNDFVEQNHIHSVIEWGCGDGNQLRLAQYPQYVGYDVSKKAIEICSSMFKEDNKKQFIYCGEEGFKNQAVAELVLSLDVIYHLVEDDVYDKYMRRLFDSSTGYVCIYSSNFDKQTASHVRHREFQKWIEGNVSGAWRLEKMIQNPFPYSENDVDNTSYSDFYFYKKVN